MFVELRKVEGEGCARSLTEYVSVKVSQSELEGWLWGAADILRGAVKPEKYGSYMLPLLFYKRLSDVYLEEFEEAVAKYKDEKVAGEKLFHRFDIPGDYLWGEIRKVSTNLGEKLNNVLDRIAKLNPILDGVINRVDFNKKEEIPEDRLIRLVEHFSKYRLGNRDVEPDVLGRAYEYLLKKFNEEAPQRAGEFYTPREVVKVLVNILDPDEGYEIYDPCSGSGGMLIVSHYYLAGKGKDPKKLFLHGQEINVDTWAISMMNVLLHDMEAEIKRGDTFADPKFLDKTGSLRKFDIVVANPMWNQDGYKPLMENDRFGRFVYGIAPNSSADWGWIQHMLASLKPTSRMGIVLDQGVLFRGGSEGEIRKKVVEEDLVECVVVLPEKLFYNTGAPGCLMFLNKNKPLERKSKVLFIYAGNDYEKLKNMNQLREKDIDRIIKTHREFKDVEKYAKVVSLEKIKESDHNLSVTRYVDIFDEDEQIDVKRTWQGLKSLETARMKIDEQMKTHLRELGYE
jgi:type I restriction enzyme M protein